MAKEAALGEKLIYKVGKRENLEYEGKKADICS